MRIRLCVLVIAGVVAAARPAHAQRLQSPLERDSVLRSLIGEAVARSPALREGEATLRAAASRVRPAGTLPDPVAQTGLMDLVLPDFAFGRSDFTEWDVSLAQDLPWPGTLGARAAVARAGEAGARAGLAVRRREIAAATAAAYYRLRYFVTALAILERQRRLLDAAYDLSTTRYATGTAPQSDALQARLARERLAAEAAALRGEQAASLAALNALRDRPATDSVFVPTMDTAEIRAHLFPLPAADSLVAAALGVHPRLAAHQAAVDQAWRTIHLERLGARPDFSLSLRYGYRGSVAGTPLPDFFSAFVSLRLPVWAGRKQHQLVAAARADSSAAAAALRETEVELAREVVEMLRRAEAGGERLQLLSEGVLPAARATVESVLRSYQVGRTEFLTLLAVEDALFRVQLELAAVAAEHQTHLVMLWLLTAEEIAP